ncbi:hypothetical protein ACOSQ2_021211 [Xanthoceras sorbifolium]
MTIQRVKTILKTRVVLVQWTERRKGGRQPPLETMSTVGNGGCRAPSCHRWKRRPTAGSGACGRLLLLVAVMLRTGCFSRFPFFVFLTFNFLISNFKCVLTCGKSFLEVKSNWKVVF